MLMIEGQGRRDEADFDDDERDDQALGEEDVVLGEPGAEQDQADALADDLDADEELDDVPHRQEGVEADEEQGGGEAEVTGTRRYSSWLSLFAE